MITPTRPYMWRELIDGGHRIRALLAWKVDNARQHRLTRRKAKKRLDTRQ